MSIDALLSRLDGVRKTGAETWIARCPAHGDKSPSLSVREKNDGRVLVHCFAGCSAHEVLSAVDLTMEALFPEKPIYHNGKPDRRPFPAADALRCLADESFIVLSCGVSVLNGCFTEKGRERLVDAVCRIQAAMTVTGGCHE